MKRFLQILWLPFCLSSQLVSAEKGDRVSYSSHHFPEAIYYFDPTRPPIIEIFVWDDKEHWQLSFVHFDSDGDWALDTSMHFWEEPKHWTVAKKVARQKIDERYKIVRKDNVKFTPFDETRKNILRVYPQSRLYQALEGDKAFRLNTSGSLRLLGPPLPADPKNFDLRESAGYQGLLERLMKVKLSPPPKVSQNQ